jgi:hypothetical protein
MSPETRAFLDAVRHADDPAPEDERRVLAAVHAAVAAGVVVAGSVGVSKVAKVTTLFGLSALKLGGILVAIGALSWTLGWALSARDTPPARAITPSGRAVSGPAPIATVARPVASAREEHEKPPARLRASSEFVVRDPAPASLREEIALLAEVRAALARGDGATALARLDAHVTTDRQLRAERRAARILALCAVGRADEARQAAAEFLRNEPDSLQRAAIERSCAGMQHTDER